MSKRAAPWPPIYNLQAQLHCLAARLQSTAAPMTPGFTWLEQFFATARLIGK
jgi:hypothetical protein